MSDNARAGAFFIFGINTAKQVPVCVLSVLREKWDNIPMNTIIDELRKIGLPEEEIFRILTCYQNDFDGLQHYYLYMRAMFDDRHEYV